MNLPDNRGRQRESDFSKNHPLQVNSGTGSVTPPSGSFRAAYQALPRSLVEQLDALAGGRHPAMKSHS